MWHLQKRLSYFLSQLMASPHKYYIRPAKRRGIGFGLATISLLSRRSENVQRKSATDNCFTCGRRPAFGLKNLPTDQPQKKLLSPLPVCLEIGPFHFEHNIEFDSSNDSGRSPFESHQTPRILTVYHRLCIIRSSLSNPKHLVKESQAGRSPRIVCSVINDKMRLR